MGALLLAACAPLPPPLVSDLERDSIYGVIRDLTARQYFDTLFTQVPEVPVPGWSTDTVSLKDVWPVFEYGYTTTALNMRAGPSTESDVLQVVPQAARVVFELTVTDRPAGNPGPTEFVLDVLYEADPNWNFSWQGAREGFKEGPWVRVRHGLLYGWVHSDYVRLPTVAELSTNRAEGVQAATQGIRTLNVWAWLLIGLPAAVLADLGLFYIYGDRRVFITPQAGLRWRMLGGAFGPAIAYMAETVHTQNLPVSQWTGYLMVAAGITLVIGLPATWISEGVVEGLDLAPLPWAE